MKKIILVLIISLGLMSCEKYEPEVIQTYVFECFEIKDDLRVGDLILDKSWGEYKGSEEFTLSSIFGHNIYKLNLYKKNGLAFVGSCSINDKSIDFEIWRVKVFNLYYNL
jgi:hypothetical protein